MHDRLDDLFILDAEQAARELLIYGEGRSDLPTERLSGTTEYLAPLLQSCGLLRHADACVLFADLFEVADEGQIKRLVREFAELSIQSLEALKAGSTISELVGIDELERLIGRLQQFSPSSSQTQLLPYPSRFRQIDSHHADPDRELIANAFRAIEAVDSLAVMIAQEAQGHVAAAVVNHEIQGLMAEAIDGSEASGFSDQIKAQPDITETPALHADVVATPTSAPVEAFQVNASMAKSALALQSVEIDPTTVKDAVHRKLVSSLQIDAAFRKALRLSHDGPWAQGMTTLLESIDILDHVCLTEALPKELSLLGGNDIVVQPELARMLGEELHQARVSGVGDAMLVSQTLILAIQHDRLVPADRLAKQIAFQGGRIEVDTALKRWRIVVPASARLLRVAQLQVEGAWLAVPWAQFLGLEGRLPPQEAQLCIGDESDKLRIEALGLLCTGVRFELPRPLRRRERYRGLVMLATADCLPVYA